MTFWHLGAQGWHAVARRDVLTEASPTPPDWFQPISGGKASLPPFDTAAARAQLVGVDEAFAVLSVAKGQAVAFPAYAGLEAVSTGGAMTYGRDAIAARYAGVPID